TEAVHYGPTKNPWNTELSAGGSSGGAAASVAGGIVPIAHANDGAGSIRQPAAVNGLVGLKPTRGNIPNGPYQGEILSGLGNEFVVTKSVRDSALLLDTISGSDKGARNWFKSNNDYFISHINKEPRKLRIAWMDTPFNKAPVDNECKEALYKTVKLCEELGYELVEDAPTINSDNQFIATMRMWAANITKNINKIKTGLNRIPSNENMEASNIALYEYGLDLSAEQLLEAFDINNIISRTMGDFFSEYDILLSPTIAQLPWKIGE